MPTVYSETSFSVRCCIKLFDTFDPCISLEDKRLHALPSMGNLRVNTETQDTLVSLRGRRTGERNSKMTPYGIEQLFHSELSRGFDFTYTFIDLYISELLPRRVSEELAGLLRTSSRSNKSSTLIALISENAVAFYDRLDNATSIERIETNVPIEIVRSDGLLLSVEDCPAPTRSFSSVGRWPAGPPDARGPFRAATLTPTGSAEVFGPETGTTAVLIQPVVSGQRREYRSDLATVLER